MVTFQTKVPGWKPRLPTLAAKLAWFKSRPGRVAKPLVSLTDPRGLPPLVASRPPRPCARLCKLALIDYADHCIPMSCVVCRVCKRARQLCKLASGPSPVAPVQLKCASWCYRALDDISHPKDVPVCTSPAPRNRVPPGRPPPWRHRHCGPIPEAAGTSRGYSPGASSGPRPWSCAWL